MGPFCGANQWGQGTMLPDTRRRARPSDVCFFCGKTGHWQSDCPEQTSRKCEYSVPGHASDDMKYDLFDYAFSSDENGYVSTENILDYCVICGQWLIMLRIIFLQSIIILLIVIVISAVHIMMFVCVCIRILLLIILILLQLI